MQRRGPYIVESCVGAIDYRVKMGSKKKTYHVNMSRSISGEPDVDGNVVYRTDSATMPRRRPRAGRGARWYRRREGVLDVKLGDELPEDQDVCWRI